MPGPIDITQQILHLRDELREYHARMTQTPDGHSMLLHGFGCIDSGHQAIPENIWDVPFKDYIFAKKNTEGGTQNLVYRIHGNEYIFSNRSSDKPYPGSELRAQVLQGIIENNPEASLSTIMACNHAFTCGEITTTMLDKELINTETAKQILRQYFDDSYATLIVESYQEKDTDNYKQSIVDLKTHLPKPKCEGNEKMFLDALATSSIQQKVSQAIPSEIVAAIQPLFSAYGPTMQHLLDNGKIPPKQDQTIAPSQYRAISQLEVKIALDLDQWLTSQPEAKHTLTAESLKDQPAFSTLQALSRFITKQPDLENPNLSDIHAFYSAVPDAYKSHAAKIIGNILPESEAIYQMQKTKGVDRFFKKPITDAHSDCLKRYVEKITPRSTTEDLVSSKEHQALKAMVAWSHDTKSPEATLDMMLAVKKDQLAQRTHGFNGVIQDECVNGHVNDIEAVKTSCMTYFEALAKQLKTNCKSSRCTWKTLEASEPYKRLTALTNLIQDNGQIPSKHAKAFKVITEDSLLSRLTKQSDAQRGAQLVRNAIDPRSRTPSPQPKQDGPDESHDSGIGFGK